MIGIFLGVIAAGFATSKDIVSKRIASASVDGNTSAFASFLFALPMYGIVLFLMRLSGYETFHTERVFWVYVTARALSDAVAESSKMFAFSNGELSVVSSIIALHPVFMLAASPLITGDPLSRRIVAAVLLSVAGTSFITYKSGSGGTSKKGIIYAVICAVFFSINTSFDRLTVQAASPAFSGFVMTAIACALLFPPILRAGRSKDLVIHWRPFLVRGMFETAFMVIKLSALTFLSAPELAAITRLSVLFSVIGGNVMFRELHLGRKIAGALLTLCGAAVVIFWSP